MRKIIFTAIMFAVASFVGVRLAYADCHATYLDPGVICCAPPDENLMCGLSQQGWSVQSSCSLGGNAGGGNQSQYCKSDGTSGTSAGNVLTTTSAAQGSVPSSYLQEDAYDNLGPFSGPLSISLSVGGTNGALATIGAMSVSTPSVSCGRSETAQQTGEVNPGDQLMLTVYHTCGEDSGYSNDWGSGAASFSINNLADCYTAQALQWQNQYGGGDYQNVTDYIPTGPDTCTPASVPQATVQVTSVDTGGNPVSSSWTLSGPSGAVTDTGTSKTYSNDSPGNYSLAAGSPPSGYGSGVITPASSQTVASGGTILFTIIWKKNPTLPPSCSDADTSVNVGSSTTFTAAGGSGIGYTWSVQGGSPSSGQGSTITVTPSSAQTATINAQVTDSNGQTSPLCSIPVNAAPGQTPGCQGNNCAPPNPVSPKTVTGSISVNSGNPNNPQTCQIASGQSTCTTQVTWSTQNALASDDIRVIPYPVGGALDPGHWMDTGMSGSDAAPWVGTQGLSFGLILCNDDQGGSCSSYTLLGSATAYGAAAGTPGTPPGSNPVTYAWTCSNGSPVCKGSDGSIGSNCQGTQPSCTSGTTPPGSNPVTYAWTCSNGSAVCEGSDGSIGTNCQGSQPSCGQPGYSWSCHYNPVTGGHSDVCLYGDGSDGIYWQEAECGPDPGTECPSAGSPPGGGNGPTGGTPGSPSTPTTPDTYGWECVFGSSTCVDETTDQLGGNNCGPYEDVCPPPIVVTIAPPTATVTAGQSFQFTATVTGGPSSFVAPKTGIALIAGWLENTLHIPFASAASQSVTWSATQGSISASGLFMAPNVSSPTTVTITAVSLDDLSSSGSATVTVYPPAQCTINAVPPKVILGTKTKLQWSCQYAVSCSLQGQSVDPNQGTLPESPIETTQYILTCVNGAGSSSEAAVQVNVAANPGRVETSP